ncbi:MAG: tRNA uridine(34) 5-carboxymethylaminomethyl modification radical SAM/GNAT enzyme Elp3 [Candidatus Diapherotrites archaeon]
MNWKKYSIRIIQEIEKRKIHSGKELNELKLKLCEELQLKEMPSNATILSYAKKPGKELIQLLKTKPIRSISGIASVAIMAAPQKCPGECSYCPNSLIESNMPKSYTGLEPATMRAIANSFDPKKQIENRIEQLNATGHSTQKIELIIMGGTFLASAQNYQKRFMQSCYKAVTGRRTSSMQEALKELEKTRNRLVGITFETRPDFCNKKEINRMLLFGGTRVELGVQNPDNEIYRKISRGHTVKEVINATQLLKDSAFKVCYHLMPGLPFSNPRKDLAMFKKIFSRNEFKPDMAKIYPCLVIKGTKLYEQWRKGLYEPYSTEEAAELIAKAKSFFPKWVRVMRVQRDIPSTVVAAGVKHTNLRQLIEEKMKEKGIKCNCIRCREIGHALLKKPEIEEELSEPKILVEEYNANKGKEFFISLEDTKNNLLYGFCRLRKPFNPFRKEINERTVLVRELHIYSESLPLKVKPHKREFQHRGFGKKLLEKAEEIAAEELGCKKLLVISGLGVKEYYKKLGFKDDGLYVSKSIA